MNKYIRKFNQNKQAILFEIIIVVFIIVCIQIVNIVLKNRKEDQVNNTTNEVIENNSSYNSRETVLDNKKLGKKTNDENVTIIKDFIDACNLGDTKKAYSLLSEECKEQSFLTEDEFIENYYLLFFDTKKEYNYQSWITDVNTYTYKVNLYENSLATGGKDTESSSIEEYYTVVNENKDKKLNINNFIDKVTVNKESQGSVVSVSIKEKVIFMDYEMYTIEVKNNSKNTILLDSKERANTMYLEDENENKYTAYNNEIALNRITIPANGTIKIKIKYSKTYTSTLSSKKLFFSDIILNYDEYKELDNKKEYTNRYKISIKL